MKTSNDTLYCWNPSLAHIHFDAKLKMKALMQIIVSCNVGLGHSSLIGNVGYSGRSPGQVRLSASQLIRYMHNDLISVFDLLSIPSTIFGISSLKICTDEANSVPFHFSSGFCCIRGLVILVIFFVSLSCFLAEIFPLHMFTLKLN